ncbi:hypothetical protein ACUN9W_13660, partial [Escherichia coli]
MNIELLQQLCEASAVSGDEQEVRDILINTLEPCVNEITFDGLGGLSCVSFAAIGMILWFDGQTSLA